MHYQKLCALAVSLACITLSSTTSAAPKDELAEIRQQIQAMKAQYESRIAELEKKLNQAETRVEKTEQTATRAETAASKAASAISATSQRGGQSGPSVDTSLILQGQFASFKDIPERGLTGFLPTGHAHGSDKRGFSVGHSELVVAANIDPYWSGKAIFALSNEQTVEVEEASFQNTGSDLGIGFKGGRFRSGIGYLNQQHPHHWDFADAPLAYKALFGSHGAYTQEGVQLKWLAPLDSVALSFGIEAGRGVSFPATQRNKNDADSLSAFAKLGGDLGIENAWQVGLGYLRTTPKDREAHLEGDDDKEATGRFNGRSGLWLADFVWKWAPNGNPSQKNFKLQGEYFVRDETGDLGCFAKSGETSSCDKQVGAFRTKQTGWYAQAVYQFMPRWRVGYRVDVLDSGNPYFDTIALPNLNSGNGFLQNYRPRRDSLMMDYSWSEFSRARLQFAQDKAMEGIADNQIFLQYIMSLGAHGAHKF